MNKQITKGPKANGYLKTDATGKKYFQPFLYGSPVNVGFHKTDGNVKPKNR